MRRCPYSVKNDGSGFSMSVNELHHAYYCSKSSLMIPCNVQRYSKCLIYLVSRRSDRLPVVSGSRFYKLER